jgi:hypothetical protein
MIDDEGEAGAEGDPVSTRGMAAIIKNGRVRISLVVLVLVCPVLTSSKAGVHLQRSATN